MSLPAAPDSHDWQSESVRRLCDHGRAQGRAQGWTEALLTVLRSRGLGLDAVHGE